MKIKNHFEETAETDRRIFINPPRVRGRCDVCGRHISELKPYGKAGDPLVGDFEGVYLIKFFRPDGYLGREQLDIIYESSERSPDDPDVWIVPDFEYYYGSDRSWECRDCVALSDEEYFNKFGMFPQTNNSYLARISRIKGHNKILEI